MIVVTVITVLNVMLSTVHFLLVLTFRGRTPVVSKQSNLSDDRSLMANPVKSMMMQMGPDEEEDPKFGYVTMPRNYGKKTMSKFVLVPPPKGKKK
ncbi:hypothetical protein V3C99_007042 [Haemonchus contortus]